MYKTKVDIVYDTLLHGIENGEYKPGARLIISQISKKCQVSDIPVREAIRRLSSEGYVTLTANQGAIVNRFTAQLVDEFIQIKAVLEGYASRLAVDYLTHQDYENLRKLNEELHQSAQTVNYDKTAELNVQFHMYMYRRLPQQELCEMIADLWEKYRITRKIFQFNPARSQVSVEEHEAILQLMEQKKYDEVERAVRAHKMSTAPQLSQQLQKMNP